MFFVHFVVTAVVANPLYSRTFTAENAELAEESIYDKTQRRLDEHCVSLADPTVFTNSKDLTVLCGLGGLGGE